MKPVFQSTYLGALALFSILLSQFCFCLALMDRSGTSQRHIKTDRLDHWGISSFTLMCFIDVPKLICPDICWCSCFKLIPRTPDLPIQGIMCVSHSFKRSLLSVFIVYRCLFRSEDWVTVLLFSKIQLLWIWIVWSSDWFAWTSVSAGSSVRTLWAKSAKATAPPDQQWHRHLLYNIAFGQSINLIFRVIM